MNLNLLRQKNDFPLYVQTHLARMPIDYCEKHLSITRSNSTGSNQLEAGVVVLLVYKDAEYSLQLIKRSEMVAQAGDISCPGGILERKTDEMLSHILLTTGMIRSFDNRKLSDLPNKSKKSLFLIQLFLMNALREAWEEIGLSPLNISFLGALPSYSLTYFSRTIFPVVCLVKEPYEDRLSEEVEKVMEIPLSYFFKSSSYAIVEIISDQGTSDPRYNVQFPGLVIPNMGGKFDILWGATFQIVTNFLKFLAPDLFPSINPSKKIQKTLSPNYASGKR